MPAITRWEARPAVAIGVSLPLDAGIHGVLRLEGGFSRETFAPADAPAIAEERRHRGREPVGLDRSPLR